MKFSSITTRAAVAGATTALAVGALVGLGSTAANAATVSNTYTCSLGSIYSGQFPLAVTAELPVSSYGAGAPVPSLIPVTAKATIPADAAGMLQVAGVTGAKSDDFAFPLGTSRVPVPLEGDFSTTDGTTTWTGTGKNQPFVTPVPGRYDAVLPAAFTMTTMQGDTESASLDCVLADGETAQPIGSIDLVKQVPGMTVAKTITAKATKAIKIPVAFSNSTGGVGVGKVVAKEGKKTLKSAAVKNGKATLNLGKLKPGVHTVTVSYIGNPSVAAASAKVKIKVTR